MTSSTANARATVEAHERTHLTEADSRAFLTALDTPAQSPEALRALFKLHRAMRSAGS